jgi:undecaprenyl-diphosphatase
MAMRLESARMLNPNPFDSSIVMFLDRFAHRWQWLDHLACGFEGEPLLKGGVLTAALWWAWFRRGAEQAHARSVLVAGVVSSIAALAVCRMAALALPYRQRPIFTDSLGFVAPFGTDSSSLINWSSLPSDHAGLFYCLSAVLYFISRRAGILAYIYTTLCICLPRVYLGDHYPTDILAGAAIGIFIAWLFQRPPVRDAVAGLPLDALKGSPAMFYMVSYVGSLQLATNFDLIRKVGAIVFHSLRTHGSS